MPLQCEFIGGARIARLSLKKDQRDPDVLAAEVKLTGRLPEEVLSKLLDCGYTQIQGLWHHDAEGTPRFPAIKKASLSNAYKDHYLILRGYRFSGACIKNISYACIDGRCIEVTLTAALAHPFDDELMLLTELLQESAECSIDCDPDLFEAVPGEPPEKEPMTERQEALDVSVGGDIDPLYTAALAFALHSKKFSISVVQAEFRIGYNRAARLVEALRLTGAVADKMRSMRTPKGQAP